MPILTHKEMNIDFQYAVDFDFKFWAFKDGSIGVPTLHRRPRSFSGDLLALECVRCSHYTARKTPGGGLALLVVAEMTDSLPYL